VPCPGETPARSFEFAVKVFLGWVWSLDGYHHDVGKLQFPLDNGADRSGRAAIDACKVVLGVAASDGDHGYVPGACDDGSPFAKAHLLGNVCGKLPDDIGALDNFREVLFVYAVSFCHDVAPARMSVAAVIERRAECGIFGAYKTACRLV